MASQHIAVLVPLCQLLQMKESQVSLCLIDNPAAAYVLEGHPVAPYQQSGHAFIKAAVHCVIASGHHAESEYAQGVSTVALRMKAKAASGLGVQSVTYLCVKGDVTCMLLAFYS